MFIFWGHEHTCLYNDAYCRSLGPEKHPSILGAPGRESWEEIWPIIGPQIEQVMRGKARPGMKINSCPSFATANCRRCIGPTAIARSMSRHFLTA